MRVALDFFNQYEEDGNDYLERIITGDESWNHFYTSEKKSVSMVWKKKRKCRENSRMNGQLGR